MSKRCCPHHNNMVFEETDLTDCGMAGMGTPTVCCRNCPDNIYPDGMAEYYIDSVKPKPRYLEIDENAEIAPDLDDAKFVSSREAILMLLPRLFPNGASRFSSLEPMERLIDETVEEIAHIWLQADDAVNDLAAPTPLGNLGVANPPKQADPGASDE